MTMCMTVNKAEIDLTPENIMLNRVHAKPKHIINYLVLIVKQYLFYCKCANKSFVFVEIIHKIESMYQMEYYNAKHNDKLRKSFRRWEPYSEVEFPVT